MAITLELVKRHLRVEHSEEDDLIWVYAKSSLAWLQAFTGLPLSDFLSGAKIMTDELGTVLTDELGNPLISEVESVTSLTEAMDTATLLITASLYQSRGAAIIPDAAKMLANPYRVATFTGG
jgi:hypothetical protein